MSSYFLGNAGVVQQTKRSLHQTERMRQGPSVILHVHFPSKVAVMETRSSVVTDHQTIGFSDAPDMRTASDIQRSSAFSSATQQHSVIAN